MNKLLLLLTAGCTTFASCTSFDRTRLSDNINRGVRLAEVTTDDGTREVWRAYPGNDTQPRIEKTSTRVRVVPHIGVFVKDVDRERAETSGATPWRGVWIQRVVSGEPADRAGIVRGDIVLSIGDTDVNSSKQFLDLLANLDAKQPLSLLLRQKRKPGTAIDAEHTVVVPVTPIGKKLRESTTDSFPLEHSKGVQSYTGLQVAAVAPDLAKSIYGTEQPITLVTGIVTGSPAYNAGLRAGDQVTKVDGRPVQSVQDVRDAVLARVHEVLPTAPTYDLTADRTEPLNSGRRADDIQLEVNGPLGMHEASLAISDDVTEKSRFYIPIVVSYSAQANRTRVGFLNFIFQFGFNYTSRSYPSATRAPIESSRLSILPLGMFEINHGVSGSHYRLFWLINFGSDS